MARALRRWLAGTSRARWVSWSDLEQAIALSVRQRRCGRTARRWRRAYPLHSSRGNGAFTRVWTACRARAGGRACT
eukprot:1956772-Pleurochrysis_carterae.AAC.2